MKKLNYLAAAALLALAVLFIPTGTRAALIGNTTKATLSLSPATGSTYNVNDNFTVSINLNTNGQNVVVVAAYLNYDKNSFQVISLDTTGSDFTTALESTIDATNGKIKITQAIPTPGINLANALVAKINFKALASTLPLPDNLTFDFTPGSTLDSNVIKDDGLGTDILSGVYNARIWVNIPDTTPPGIFNVAAIASTTTATVTWATDETATSQLNYGLTTNYTSTTTLDTNLVTAHSINLTGLSTNTLYHYRIRTKDAFGNERISGDFTFTTADTAPVMTSITIAPNPAFKTIANLTANAVAIDADGDALTFTYQWKKGGVNIFGQTSKALSNSNYVKNDVISVTVTPNDGKLNGGSLTSANLTIANSAPVLTQVTITPNPAYKSTTNLTANPTASDADSDTITYLYQWKKNGIDIAGQTNSTLSNSNYAKGELMTVSVTPNDGVVSGSALMAAGVTILNSLPTMPLVSITTPAYDSTNLTCTPTGSTDANGDPISYSFAWYKNSLLQSGLITNTVSASDTGIGETWKCSVTPNDGTANGTAGENTAAILADPDIVPPVITNIASTTSTGTTTITWTTNKLATSQVNYGLTANYTATTTLNTNLVTAHSVTITGLITNSLYHFRVRSKDAAGNETVSGDYIFKTLATADLNLDGLVNSVDVNILMSNWGSTARPRADINQDSMVNSVDAGIMMSQWTN